MFMCSVFGIPRKSEQVKNFMVFKAFQAWRLSKNCHKIKSAVLKLMTLKALSDDPGQMATSDKSVI